MIGSSLLTPRAAKSNVRQGIVGVTKKRGTEALSPTLGSLLVSPGIAGCFAAADRRQRIHESLDVGDLRSA